MEVLGTMESVVWKAVRRFIPPFDVGSNRADLIRRPEPGSSTSFEPPRTIPRVRKPSQPRVFKPATQIPKFAINSDSRVQARNASRRVGFPLSFRVLRKGLSLPLGIHPNADAHIQLYCFVPAWILSGTRISRNSRFTS